MLPLLKPALVCLFVDFCYSNRLEINGLPGPVNTSVGKEIELYAFFQNQVALFCRLFRCCKEHMVILVGLQRVLALVNGERIIPVISFYTIFQGNKAVGIWQQVA